jgi:hypothetical protein
VATKKPVEKIIVIPAIKRATMRIDIKFLTPLITHAWDPKIIQEMIDKRIKGGVSANSRKTHREPKNPEDDFYAGLYWVSEYPGKLPLDQIPAAIENGRFGVPAQALKNAIVSAGALVDGVHMTYLRKVLHIEELDLLEIKGPPPTKRTDRTLLGARPVMRTDMVRLGSGLSKVPDVRHRPMFEQWSMEVPITFLKDRIGPAELVNLINLAGYAVGIGDWRPECNGVFGRFEVAEAK